MNMLSQGQVMDDVVPRAAFEARTFAVSSSADSTSSLCELISRMQDYRFGSAQT